MKSNLSILVLFCVLLESFQKFLVCAEALRGSPYFSLSQFHSFRSHTKVFHPSGAEFHTEGEISVLFCSSSWKSTFPIILCWSSFLFSSVSFLHLHKNITVHCCMGLYVCPLFHPTDPCVCFSTRAMLGFFAMILQYSWILGLVLTSNIILFAEDCSGYLKSFLCLHDF